MEQKTINKIIDMRLQGIFCSIIAEKLDLHTDQVYYICKKNLDIKLINELKADKESVVGELEKGYGEFIRNNVYLE